MAKKIDTKALARKSARYLQLRELIKPLEAEYDLLKEELLELSIAAGGVAETAAFVVKVVSQERRTISRDKLVELGVTPKVIAGATIITPVSFATVTRKKEEAA
jgi:hypothetical protein